MQRPADLQKVVGIEKSDQHSKRPSHKSPKQMPKIAEAVETTNDDAKSEASNKQEKASVAAETAAQREKDEKVIMEMRNREREWSRILIADASQITTKLVDSIKTETTEATAELRAAVRRRSRLPSIAKGYTADVLLVVRDSST